MNLIELEDRAKQSARATIDSGSEHPPLFFVITSGGGTAVLAPCSELDERFKGIFQEVVSRILKKIRAAGYVFVFEGYLATGGAAEKACRDNRQISSLPPDDREEALVIISSMRGGPASLQYAVISRYAGRRTLGEFQTPPGVTGVGGRMLVTEW